MTTTAPPVDHAPTVAPSHALGRRFIAAGLLALVATVTVIAMLMAVKAGAPSRLFVPLPAGHATPEIVASADPRADGSIDLRLDVSHFGFVDICRPADGRRAIGHAHVYLAGKKIAAAYSPLAVLPKLAPGRHTLLITLQATDHRAFVTPNGMITTTLTVDVPAPAGPPAATTA